MAWSTGVYHARCQEHGNPEDAAREMQADPEYFLRHFLHALGPVEGCRVLNLLGSCARKAVPLALLGADVTVVDISEDNRRYAIETAEAAGVTIEFKVCDAMSFLSSIQDPAFDICLMEGGVLHYFQDLVPLFSGVRDVLEEGGRFVLHEFHPFRKLSHAGVDGYFDSEPHESPVPVRTDDSGPKCIVRYWNLTEMLAATRISGLTIELFEEQPNRDDATIPSFILLQLSP
jgi:SAM-dependent methyltransferase